MKRHLRTIALILLFAGIGTALHPQATDAGKKNNNEPKTDGLSAEIKKNKKLKLTLEKVVDYLIKQNYDVMKGLIDYKRAATELRKFQGKFDPNLYGKGNYSSMQYSKEDPMSMFNGTKMTQKDYEVGISKKFSTGTSIQLGVNGITRDTQGVQTFPGFPDFNGTAYQSNYFVGISQELLKNTFGISDRLNEKIIANAAEMQRRAVKMYLANLLVEALVGYWNVSAAEENLETVKISYNRTVTIRNLIRRKLALGLADREEVLDWDGRMLQGKNAVDVAEKLLYDARLAVLRTLNLDLATDIEIGKTFQTTAPEVSYEVALKDAYARRVDFANQKTIVKNAELDLSIARHQTMPSVRLNARAGSTDYSKKGYSDTFNDINRQWSVGFEVNYPLGDTEATAKARDAALNYHKCVIVLKDMEKKIRDDIDSTIRQCALLFSVYQKTKSTHEYYRNYYYQVYQKFRTGRYNAVQLKLALDNYIQMRQMELRSLIDYNVSLLRRDLERNIIFDKFGINIDEILKRLEKQG